MITTRKRRAWLAPAAVLVVIATVAVWLRDRRDLRAPVGARRKDIRAQFVVEAMTLTGVGGVIGILGGAVVTVAVAFLFPARPARLSLFWTGMGLLISLGVGLFFGIYPAVKAANLDPVRCLRYE